MAVTIRNAGAEPPIAGDVLIRWLNHPDDLPASGWTLGGNGAVDGWFGWRHFTNGDTYLRTDSVITPVDWRQAAYSSVAEALAPREG